MEKVQSDCLFSCSCQPSSPDCPQLPRLVLLYLTHPTTLPAHMLMILLCMPSIVYTHANIVNSTIKAALSTCKASAVAMSVIIAPCHTKTDSFDCSHTTPQSIPATHAVKAVDSVFDDDSPTQSSSKDDYNIDVMLENY